MNGHGGLNVDLIMCVKSRIFYNDTHSQECHSLTFVHFGNMQSVVNLWQLPRVVPQLLSRWSRVQVVLKLLKLTADQINWCALRAGSVGLLAVITVVC